jgi:type VI secretion system secreted protein VgrG
MAADRFVALTGSAASSFVFARMSGHEELGRPFEYQLELLGEDPNMDLSKFLGDTMTVSLAVASEGTRYFNGVVTKFWLAGTHGRYARYRAVLNPWFSLLRHKKDARIFQSMTVPDVVKQIFGAHPFALYEESLQETYRTWDYIVQYHESEFNFVSRILEQEGIYYYFKHADGKHTLVLADSPQAHEANPNYSTVEYHQPNQQMATSEYLDSWSVERQIVSGAYAATDFNFETPRTDLLRKQAKTTGGANTDLEVFDYPGGYFKGSEGDTLVSVRLQEEQLDYERFDAAGTARGLSSGCKFTLADFPRDDQNKEYVVVQAVYDLAANPSESGVGQDAHFRCAVQCIDSKIQFRAAQTTPKPRIEGPQTAIVTGPAGEEIWTDKYGRVKLHFHWDRYGTVDEKSSCWIRVAQVWAGANWGAIHTPRIGQEVIVEFLEGDPDRPIVTGRVYNGVNMPPYTLTAQQTQSGIKSRSTKGGNVTNANEIRFEDLKGSEDFYIQAEKTQTTLVKGSQSVTVNGSRSKSVGGDESITVKGTRTVTITKSDTESYKDTRETTVTQTDKLTVQQLATRNFDNGRSTTTKGANEELTVNGVNMVTTVHGEYNITADTHFSVKQKSDSFLLENKCALHSEGPITIDNNNCEIDLKDGKMTLIAATQLTLVCGQASITLKKDGTIEITGGTKVALSGGSAASLELAAAGATMSGPKVTVSGSAATEITGAIVKIN